MNEYEKLLKKARKEIPSEILVGARFEIPKADILYQGNNTIVHNFSSIVNTLRRDQKHFMKFLVGELGTAGVLKGRELRLKGRISRDLIDKRIKTYAEEFVLCHECGKPDTKIIKKDRVRLLKCEACGATHPIKLVR